LKKPSTVRSPVRKGLSLSSTSTGHQVGGFGIGARQQDGGHAHHVGRQARGHQLGHRLPRGHQHLAAHVAALLHAGELVFEVHAGGARIDHGLHQLEGVEHAAKACFGVGHDGREVVDVVLAFAPLDLVGAGKGALMRLTTLGTESTEYRLWSGYISPLSLASLPPASR
jgi:hypothetical protein